MSTLSYKTISANKNTVKKEWIVIDAENEVVQDHTAKIGAKNTDYNNFCVVAECRCKSNCNSRDGACLAEFNSQKLIHNFLC